jgi:hypothetical protein
MIERTCIKYNRESKAAFVFILICVATKGEPFHLPGVENG